MKQSNEISVCVIGAGVCGLVSVKSCLEAGYRVTCYDKSPTYGGLWCYSDERRNTDGQFKASVMRTTILNTSKELSSFSDFPPPAELPNFMKHNLYMDYIRSYVEHFKLEPHLRLRHEILSLQPEYHSELDEVKWKVEVRDNRKGSISSQKFDRVMVAVGHHNIPYSPTFTDQHKFRGQILHTAKIKDILTDERLIDKRVVVVGLGNSACDAANDLALVATKCYVSCHRGSWFVGRLSPSGLYDFEDKNRWNHELGKLVPRSMLDRIIVKHVSRRIDHKLLGLQPRHKPSELAPAINDLFPFRIFTGGIVLKGSLKRFTENGVIFEGEEEIEYKADIVLLATGYEARMNFLDEHKLGLRMDNGDSDEYNLYLNMFAPNLRIPGVEPGNLRAIRTLAIIGLFQPSGSITVVSELQARLVALVFGDKCKLPNVGQMLKHIEEVKDKHRSTAIRSHSRDQLVGSWIGYCDMIAKLTGVKPNFSKLFFKDFALWKQLVFGPSVSYQYRLMGPGSWPKARETIMSVDDRVLSGINEGKNQILYGVRRKRL